MNRKFVSGLVAICFVVSAVFVAIYLSNLFTSNNADKGWQEIAVFKGQGNGTSFEPGLCMRTPPFYIYEGNTFKVRFQFVDKKGTEVGYWILEKSAGSILTFGFDQFKGLSWQLKETEMSIETGEIEAFGTFNISIRTNSPTLTWTIIVEAKGT